MEMTQIEPGQNWLNNINENFDKLLTKVDVKVENTEDYVMLNGVTPVSEHTKIFKYPLPGGASVKRWQFCVYIKHMSKNSDLLVAKVPEEYQETDGQPHVGRFPVSQGGHVVGELDVYFANTPCELHLAYFPLMSDPEDLNNVEVNLALTWY